MTTPRVRKTASTTPRNSVVNIASPSRNAPANVRVSTWTSWGGVISRARPADEVVREPEENEEDRGEHDDDREHLPAHRLAQRVLDDDRDVAQFVSPPTASR